MDFDLLAANYTPIDIQGKTPKKKQKGFLTDQISTGGGIGGALAGGAAGAAIGSVVPVIGTGIGGLLGAVIGGGLGSAGGEMAENVITGDELSKDVLKEGLIGGATSLPIGAGLKLARAGVKATTGLGKVAASDLVRQAGMDSIGKGTVSRLTASGMIDDATAKSLQGLKKAKSGKVASTVDNVASSVMASQSGMTASQARKLGLRPVDTFSNIFNRTGLTRLDDMAEVGKNLTGGKDSLLDTLTRAAFENVPGIKLEPLRRTAQQIMDDGTSLLSKSERGRVIENMKNAEIAIGGGSKGSLASTGNALAALDQANSFRSVARDLKNGFNITPKDKQMAKIYDGVAESIERSLYSARGVSQSVPMLTKAGADDLLFKAQAAREAGNEAQAKAFESVANELRSATSVKDIRSLKKDWVDIGKVDKATAEAEGARTLTGQQFRTNAANTLTSPKAMVGAAIDAKAPEMAGRAKALSSMVPQRTPGQALLPLAARQGIGRAVTQDPQAAPTVDPQELIDSQMMSQMDQPTEQRPTVGGYTKDQVQGAMISAVMSGDSKAADQLQALLGMFPEDAPKLTSSTAQLAAKQASGGQALDLLLQQYENAGGGQGMIGGNITNVLGGVGLNSQAAAYNDQQAATARLLSRAMGEVGSGSDSDANAYIRMLPQITDTEEQARIKIAQLRQMLANARQNTLMYGLGSTQDATTGGF